MNYFDSLLGDQQMGQHILIEKAYTYPEPIEIFTPQHYKFFEKNGYWKNPITGEILMLSKDSYRPQTKKEDRETGEDQKGE
jgi:hypothetical protein